MFTRDLIEMKSMYPLRSAILIAAALLSCISLPSSGRADEPAAREIGCFPDNKNADPLGTRGRDLDGAAFNDPAMTINKCLSLCAGQGFRFAGLQYGSWCFCGNSYDRYAGGTASCTTKCAGDKSLFCGGRWANNIWEIIPEPDTPPASTMSPPLSSPAPPIAPGPSQGVARRFELPQLGGIRLDSRPSRSGGFDVVAVAHRFCQRMGFAGMKDYRVGDARNTIAIEDGTIFANRKSSNTAYRYIVCGN